MDRINGPQQNDTLEAVTNELSFSCPICLDEHSLEDCYIASACGHRMCRDAAREVVLGAVRSAPRVWADLQKCISGMTGQPAERYVAVPCLGLGQLYRLQRPWCPFWCCNFDAGI